jgi:hypothetical protein
MPGDHGGGFIEFVNTLPDRLFQRVGITAFKIGSVDGTLEQGVAGNQ